MLLQLIVCEVCSWLEGIVAGVGVDLYVVVVPGSFSRLGRPILVFQSLAGESGAEVGSLLLEGAVCVGMESAVLREFNFMGKWIGGVGCRVGCHLGCVGRLCVHGGGIMAVVRHVGRDFCGDLNIFIESRVSGRMCFLRQRS